MLKKVMVITCTLALAGCSGNPGPREQSGAVLGAATGAILGAALSHNHHRGWRGHRGYRGGGSSGAAIVLGAIAGGLVGSSIGRDLDKADRRALSSAQYDALEYNRSGQSSHWYNPDSGHYGDVTPEPAYEQAPGEYCREYTQTVTIGGKTEQAYGTACRRPDGSWEIVGK